MSVRLQRRLCLAFALALPLTGCGGTTPLTPESAPANFSEQFSGTLSPGASAFWSFTVTAEGPLRTTLEGVNTGPLTPVQAPLRLGIGVPAGEGCAVTDSITVTSGLSTQLLRRLTPGIYCLEVRDPHTLSAPVSFVIRIIHT